MRKIAQRFKAPFERLVQCVLGEKKWFFFSVLAGLVFIILLVLYLVKYKNTEFIYNLF